MKLVQLLAKELKEWPEGISCMIQDGSGKICTCRNGFPDPYDGDWTICGPKSMCTPVYWANIGSNKHELAIDQASAIITKEQWQAEREKMNKSKWIRHRGGKCPVADGIRVVYRLRGGYVGSSAPESLMWDHQQDESDVMAYYVEESKDQEIEEVKKTNFGTITYKLEIDATEATQRIDSLVAKWGQIVSPLKWRDAIIHCQAIIEDCEREIERNVSLLDAEGLMMQKDSKNAMQHYQTDIDMSDWRNWKAGDIVECLIAPDKHEGYYFSGINYKINEVDLDDEGAGCEISVYCERAMSLWCPSSSFKFIRRP